MSTREKTNKQKVLDYVQKQFENAKEMKLFQMLRKEVEIGKNGTQRYVIKKGPNKGKIVGWYHSLLYSVWYLLAILL